MFQASRRRMATVRAQTRRVAPTPSEIEYPVRAACQRLRLKAVTHPLSVQLKLPL
jgi:hypothetical protein